MKYKQLDLPTYTTELIVQTYTPEIKVLTHTFEFLVRTTMHQWSCKLFCIIFCFSLDLSFINLVTFALLFLLLQCSTTCGEGRRERYVSCRDHEGNIADDAFCVHLPRPEAAQACMEKPCGQWRTGAWTPVKYYCITYPHPHLPRPLCPEVVQACMGKSCLQWCIGTNVPS